MPLNRYDDGRIFEGDDTSVHFGMYKSGTEKKIIPCRVSFEALEDYCGAADGDYLGAFESYRGDIESTASKKFDRLIEPDTILVVSADL